MKNKKVKRKAFSELQVGDPIYFKSAQPDRRIFFVTKITPTQVVVDRHWRYKRDSGHEIGHGMSGGVPAVPQEVAEWEAAKARSEELRKKENAYRASEEYKLAMDLMYTFDDTADVVKRIPVEALREIKAIVAKYTK